MIMLCYHFKKIMLFIQSEVKESVHQNENTFDKTIQTPGLW